MRRTRTRIGTTTTFNLIDRDARGENIYLFRTHVGTLMVQKALAGLHSWATVKPWLFFLLVSPIFNGYFKQNLRITVVLVFLKDCTYWSGYYLQVLLATTRGHFQAGHSNRGGHTGIRIQSFKPGSDEGDQQEIGGKTGRVAQAQQCHQEGSGRGKTWIHLRKSHIV